MQQDACAETSVRPVHFSPHVQLVVEDIDLAQLAGSSCARRVRSAPLRQLSARGKTLMRDAIVDELGCSANEAEELVETPRAPWATCASRISADETHPRTRHSWDIPEEPAS